MIESHAKQVGFALDTHLSIDLRLSTFDYLNTMLSDIERDKRISRGLDFINENGSDHTKAIAMPL